MFYRAAAAPLIPNQQVRVLRKRRLRARRGRVSAGPTAARRDPGLARAAVASPSRGRVPRSGRAPARTSRASPRLATERGVRDGRPERAAVAVTTRPDERQTQRTRGTNPGFVLGCFTRVFLRQSGTTCALVNETHVREHPARSAGAARAGASARVPAARPLALPPCAPRLRVPAAARAPERRPRGAGRRRRPGGGHSPGDARLARPQPPAARLRASHCLTGAPSPRARRGPRRRRGVTVCAGAASEDAGPKRAEVYSQEAS